MPHSCKRDLPAAWEGILKVALDLSNSRTVVEIDRVLKVQIQASEVEIDRPDHGVKPVREADLRMDEAGCSKIRTPAASSWS